MLPPGNHLNQEPYFASRLCALCACLSLRFVRWAEPHRPHVHTPPTPCSVTMMFVSLCPESAIEFLHLRPSLRRSAQRVHDGPDAVRVLDTPRHETHFVESLRHACDARHPPVA